MKLRPLRFRVKQDLRVLSEISASAAAADVTAASIREQAKCAPSLFSGGKPRGEGWDNVAREIMDMNNAKRRRINPRLTEPENKRV